MPKDYVGVHTRVQQAHDKYKDLSIKTEFDIKEKIVCFKAFVEFGGRIFNGSSFGKVDKEKAFEKLETVAVGRALAFAGFEIKSGIASFEEMEKFKKTNNCKICGKNCKEGKDYCSEECYKKAQKIQK